jgi:hypothetical protein
MPVNTTTATFAAGTTVLSVEALASIIHWLGLHYQVQPPLDGKTETALALLLIVAVGSVGGSITWLIRALIARWLKKHRIAFPTPPGA